MFICNCCGHDKISTSNNTKNSKFFVIHKKKSKNSNKNKHIIKYICINILQMQLFD